MNTLIITGGTNDKDFIKEHLEKNQYDIIIAVDKGLEVLDMLKIEPNYIVGDFDSINQEILNKYQNGNSQIVKLNPEKDLTDTHSSVNLAIQLKSKNIVILGGIGTRIDHTIANIHILKLAVERKIKIKIIDERNEITLINKNVQIKKDENYKYISLMPLTTEVKEVSLEGFKYPLHKKTLYIGDSLGISNELIDKQAKILLKSGILICIKSKD